MSIKNLLYTISAAATMAFAACDDVSESDRLIYVEPSGVPSDDPTVFARGVLIEDFTGQMCVNCPKATEEIERLKEEFNDVVLVPVGIHGGNMAFAGVPGTVGFRTALTDEYHAAAGSPNPPAGRINRVGAASYFTEWLTSINAEIAKPAPISLALDNTYNDADRTVSINVSAKCNAGVSGKLQLWVIEDGVKAFQMLPDGGGTDLNYTHNHVLRAAANGTWGEDFSIAQGEEKTVKCTTTLDAAWNADNVSIVAFVYDGSGVQQVTIAPAKGNQEAGE